MTAMAPRSRDNPARAGTRARLRLRTRRRAAWLLTGAASAACTAAGVACRSTVAPESTYPSTAYVYGRVSDARGQPRPDLLVVAEGYRPSCDGGQRWASGSPSTVRPDADGRYRARVVAVNPSVLCVVVQVRAADGAVRARVAGATVAFRLPEPSAPVDPFDSVRVDVVVP